MSINRQPGKFHNKEAQGFILVSVLFLIAVIAVMAVVMSATSSVQNFTSVYSLQQARAFSAARSGLDYAVQRAQDASVCTNGNLALSGINFTITLACSSVPVNEAGVITTVYTITSTASTGTFGNLNYVVRNVRASVTQ